MAYFECISGGAGGGATITVTYDSSFYNKTITCSNGTKTYTKTTTSSGSTEFSVSDEGTWTITCNGVSRTVNVVLNYTTQMVITKTITVYSAANDTISFTDAVGSKTVTTDASGQGSVSISFIPNQNITFASSVANDPSDISVYYRKTVTVTDSTTSVKVMPDGALYWYGCLPNAETMNATNGWGITDSSYPTSTHPWNSPTYYTNYLNTYANNSYRQCGIGNKNSIGDYTEVYVLWRGTNVVSGHAIQLRCRQTKATVGGNIISQCTSGSTLLTSANITNGCDYVFLCSQGSRGGTVYAFWVE